ncbi:MAG: hypothetical protein KDB27_33840 [Planctomycetales bacterium]|nr:hypothetical protein [Planctomycetales bacterium]
MLKNKKRMKRNLYAQFGIEGLEERRMLDGFGVPAAPDIVEQYFPDFASRLVESPPDPHASYRFLNYAHYDGSLYAPTAYHPDDPDILFHESESGTQANNVPRDAELIPLGFDPGEEDEVDVRGTLEADVEPRIFTATEDDGSIPLANETELKSGEAIIVNAFTGDVAYEGGDNDFYAIRDVKAGDFISVHVEGDPGKTRIDPTKHNPAVAIYNSLGQIVYIGDNTIIQVNGFFFLYASDADFVFEAPDDDDYFVMVTGAIPQGFFAPLNPFESESGLGTLSTGQYEAVIGLNSVDIDYYQVDLNAGDILGVNALGRVDDLKLIAPDGESLIGARSSISPTPTQDVFNPLPDGGVASVAFVAPETGSYYIRALNAGINLGNAFQGINQGPGDYELETKLFRPVLEQQPQGNHQILFLDFDGQEINTVIYGFEEAGNRVDLAPMSSFLGGIDVSADKEDEVIDKIIAVVEENFRDIGLHGNNGDLVRTGRHGDYRLEIRNSRDHKDPFGLPNVSRVIIGGSTADLGGIPAYGIAQSIDVGNFRTEETALVLLDILTSPAEVVVDTDGDGTPDTITPNSGSVNHYLTARGRSKIDLFANAVGNIASHEAAHFFGVWHTDNANEHPQIVDTGGVPGSRMEVGPDRILGTQDDVPLDFHDDIYDPNQGFTGLETVVNNLAFGLSSGTSRNGQTGGGSSGSSSSARGFVWSDNDKDGRVGFNENGIGNLLVYADENGNNRFDLGEPATRTDTHGNYRINNINRSQTAIRLELSPGYVVSTAAEQQYQVGSKQAGLNFGVIAGSGSNEGFDYANAPAPYPTSGVRHGIVPGLRLGATIDGEAGPQRNDDADGVRFLTDVYAGGRATIEVTVSTGNETDALLQGWIDFDGDGTWSTPGEQVIKNEQLSAGVTALSFNVPTWAVDAPSVARFRYGYEPNLSFTGSSIAGEVEDYEINLEQAGPDAVDDAYEFRRNSGEQRLAVLSNDDTRGQSPRIQSVTASSGGAAVSLSSDRQALIFAAPQGYSGTDTFSYTVIDSSGLTDTATVTVVTTPDLLSVRLVAADTSGSPITRTSVGSDFFLQAYVQDLRTNATGVNAAFLDVNYSSVLAEATGSIVYGADYPNARSGVADFGLLDEIGGSGGIDRLDGAERLLFSVPMTALAEGTVEFISTPADLSPAHDVLLYDVNEAIATDKIEYRSYSLTISDTASSTNTNPSNAMDVNGDSAVSPIDALLVINNLNGQAAAVPAGVKHFLDVSGDGAISPIDALLVINHLNGSRATAAKAAGALAPISSVESGGSSANDAEQLTDENTRHEQFLQDAGPSQSVFVRVSESDRAAAVDSILDAFDDESDLM